MKRLFFLPLFAIQASLFAQPGNAPQQSSQLEVRVQSVPSSPQTTKGAPETVIHERNEKIETTLSIIKPDAVRNRHIGDITSRFEDEGLRIIAIKMTQLTKDDAAKFYSVHKGKPFFNDLVKFMSSGPIVVMVLEGDYAISKNREIMGATNPKSALPGTIRSDFAQSITENAVHGSDSSEAAQDEIKFFFKPNEIFPVESQKE